MIGIKLTLSGILICMTNNVQFLFDGINYDLVIDP